MSEKVSNNISNYETTSNYRWYYRKFSSEVFQQQMLSVAEFPRQLPVSGLDRKYVIEPALAGRLDMISLKFYGSDHINLMWIIMLYNNILDPYKELEAGATLYIPDRNTLVQGELI